MSCTRKINDIYHIKKQCQSTSILPHVTPVERHQNNGTCSITPISAPHNPEFDNKHHQHQENIIFLQAEHMVGMKVLCSISRY